MRPAKQIKFAINRMVSPRLDLEGFLNLARLAGAAGVELRNDIEGREFANGMPAVELRGRVADAGLVVASINAQQRFNDWTVEREREARTLFTYAAALGAPGIVMCPVVDMDHGWTDAALARKLSQALKGIKQLAQDTGVIGYVEPLGMKGSTLHSHQKAAAAIREVGGEGVLQICFDTFQHFRASAGRWDDTLIGLVHVSGISRNDLKPEELTEADRGFVTAADRCGNIEKLKALFAAGYSGFVSMEPFDPAIHEASDVLSPLAESFGYIRRKT